MKSLITALAAFLLLAPALRAQTTAFTYQGVLNNGTNAATGAYDFRFRIFDGNGNVVAGPLTNAPVGVTNGQFTVTLDFGPGVFDGGTRTLEIGVRTNGNVNPYTVLSPRQALNSVPYAIQSLNASNAVTLTAPLQATNLAGTIPNSLLSPSVAVLTNTSVVFSGNVTATTFTGSGSGLSSLPATSLTGTIVDARLSTNVAFLTNTDVHFSGALSATNFTGAGHGLTNVPGAFFWITNATTSLPMLPNIGYIATNPVTPVVFTLPASPIAGDVYKVAGLGAGGWIIAQNTNQMILTGNLSDTIGQNWRTVVAGLNWSAIASSADGSKLVAAVNNGSIYTSADFGSNWVIHNSLPLTTTLFWSSVASSADGTKLAGTVGYTIYTASHPGAIYTSANSGTSWTAHTSPPLSTTVNWASVASSADGTKLVAAVRSGTIYHSTDSGTTWAAAGSPPALNGLLWTGVASSADGTKLVAVENNGQIYTSINSGVGWTQRVAGTTNWNAVASSADGTRLIAVGSGGVIFISADSGVTWVPQHSPSPSQITAVACSADGSRLAITVGGSGATGSIFLSSDSGATWTQPAGAPTVSWSGIASSADGSQLAAAVYGTGDGNIYISSQNGTTIGTNGFLMGAQHSAIELIYAGNNLFLPLNHEGTVRGY